MLTIKCTENEEYIEKIIKDVLENDYSMFVLADLLGLTRSFKSVYAEYSTNHISNEKAIFLIKTKENSQKLHDKFEDKAIAIEIIKGKKDEIVAIYEKEEQQEIVLSEKMVNDFYKIQVIK